LLTAIGLTPGGSEIIGPKRDEVMVAEETPSQGAF